VRVAVVDIGSNSTRLLVAEVDDAGTVGELERRSDVTRLAQGVDTAGHLAPEAKERVFRVLEAYRMAIEGHGCDAAVAVLTSAVRDAADGEDFTSQVAGRFGLEARVIAGEEEAQLTFLGATSERAPTGASTVVIDIGGGSTEFVIGEDGAVSFHVSVQAGVVRFSERHIATDPPAPEELQALAQDAREAIAAGVPADVRRGVAGGVAVAGTATSCAAIELELDPYDPTRVHGHVLELGTLELLLARLAAMTEDQRREVVGLHPDRAPTIVAGVIVLIEALRAFALERVEVSEHDILRGVALRRASGQKWTDVPL
jgi:exopolyphosphatase/guanosine-5'-triphosphate,3'-diphosphate pyrophosphatase